MIRTFDGHLIPVYRNSGGINAPAEIEPLKALGILSVGLWQGQPCAVSTMHVDMEVYHGWLSLKLYDLYEWVN